MLRIHRPGATTVAFDLVGPTADLVKLERELLALEERIAREGGRVVCLLANVRDVVAVLGGTSFVRFARSYIHRTASFQRAAVYVERSFVVRTVVDPIALLAPSARIRTFTVYDEAVAFVRELDPTVRIESRPPPPPA